MKVVCIKLNSGEEIIGRLVETNTVLTSNSSQYDGAAPWEPSGNVVVEQVRGITAQPMGANEMGIAFFPWSLGNTDGEFIINLDRSAVSIYPAELNLEDGYLQQTSSLAIARGNTPGIKM